MNLRHRFYRMTDGGVFSSGSDDLANIKRLQEHHRATGFQSNFKHIVELVPTPDHDDASIVAVIRLHVPNPQATDETKGTR